MVAHRHYVSKQNRWQIRDIPAQVACYSAFISQASAVSEILFPIFRWVPKTLFNVNWGAVFINFAAI